MTTQEINEALHQTVAPYLNSLSDYTDEQFNHKQADDVWSLGQMYEHVCSAATYFFLANTVRCLEQRKGQIGGEKNEYGGKVYTKYNSLPPIKVSMKAVTGQDPIVDAQAKDTYEKRLSDILKNADDLIPQIESNDGTYKTMHPAFGWLNAKEWYQMLEMHTRHHHRQKTELEAFAGI